MSFSFLLLGVVELLGLWIYGFHQIQKHLSNCLQIVVLPLAGRVRQHPVGCQARGARRSPGLCELWESFVSRPWAVRSHACGSRAAGGSPRSSCGCLARPPQPLCPCASPFVTFSLNSSCLDFPRLTFFLISSLRLLLILVPLLLLEVVSGKPGCWRGPLTLVPSVRVMVCTASRLLSANHGLMCASVSGCLRREPVPSVSACLGAEALPACRLRSVRSTWRRLVCAQPQGYELCLWLPGGWVAQHHFSTHLQTGRRGHSRG